MAELLPWIYSKMEVRAQCGHGTEQAGGTEGGAWERAQAFHRILAEVPSPLRFGGVQKCRRAGQSRQQPSGQPWLPISFSFLRTGLRGLGKGGPRPVQPQHQGLSLAMAEGWVHTGTCRWPLLLGRKLSPGIWKSGTEDSAPHLPIQSAPPFPGPDVLALRQKRCAHPSFPVGCRQSRGESSDGTRRGCRSPV